MDDLAVEANSCRRSSPGGAGERPNRNGMHRNFGISDETVGGSPVTCCFSKIGEKQCATELLFRGVISKGEGFAVESIFERFLRRNRPSHRRGEERRWAEVDFCVDCAEEIRRDRRFSTRFVNVKFSRSRGWRTGRIQVAHTDSTARPFIGRTGGEASDSHGALTSSRIRAYIYTPTRLAVSYLIQDRRSPVRILALSAQKCYPPFSRLCLLAAPTSVLVLKTTSAATRRVTKKNVN